MSNSHLQVLSVVFQRPYPISRMGLFLGLQENQQLQELNISVSLFEKMAECVTNSVSRAYGWSSRNWKAWARLWPKTKRWESWKWIQSWAKLLCCSTRQWEMRWAGALSKNFRSRFFYILPLSLAPGFSYYLRQHNKMDDIRAAAFCGGTFTNNLSLKKLNLAVCFQFFSWLMFA